MFKIFSSAAFLLTTLYGNSYEIIIANNGILNFQKKYIKEYMTLSVNNKNQLEKVCVKNNANLILYKESMRKIVYNAK